MENFARTARKDRLALPLRPVGALAQVQEPGMCGGEAGGRRGLDEMTRRTRR
jgi:hypothetical protein